MPDLTNSDLAELLEHPREDLDIELKEWLPLNQGEHRATVAREVIALANHGGGFLIIGFKEGDDGQFSADPNRPAHLNDWSQDSVHSIVQRFIDPPLQCRVHHVELRATNQRHPIIIVPGGHRVPIRARRGSSDNGKTLADKRIYIRKPGPISEEPFTTAEWDRLLELCLRNRRDDLLDGIRDLLSGDKPAAFAPVDQRTPLQGFKSTAQSRWQQLVTPLPSGTSARFPHGYYEATIRLDPALQPVPLDQLRDVLKRELKNHSGWPPFVIIDRRPYSPYAADGAIETWMGRPELNGDLSRSPSNCDFWRIAPEGLFFTRRGYREDDGWQEMKPGTFFDVGQPVRRIAEILLEVGYVARALGAKEHDVIVDLRWTGLNGRKLTSVGESNTFFHFRDETAHQDTFEVAKVMSLQRVDDALPEVVFDLLQPLYMLFDFWKLPPRFVERKIAELRRNVFPV